MLAIVGVGLIGGSVGLAAKAAGWTVLGSDDRGALDEATRLGAIDGAASRATIRSADLIVLAAPISQIVHVMDDLVPTDAPVTDVGSTKARIVQAARGLGLRGFVGGHPMTGGRLGGVGNARAELFRGARYFLTPTGDTDPSAYRIVSHFVQHDLEATTTAVEPDQHDLLMAALSHLPHLIAVALLSLASAISPEALSFAGPSFRDLTRVGASNPALWSDILAENEPAISTVLGEFTAAMHELEATVPDRPAMTERFVGAGRAYHALGGIMTDPSGRNVDIAIPVENHPGVLARVTTLMGSNGINILDLSMRHDDTRHAALVLTVDEKVGDHARRLITASGFTVAPSPHPATGE